MKKISGITKKRELKFLIEYFLERDQSEILSNIKDKPDEAKKLWDKFDAVLFKDSFWMDELDQEDIVGIDFEKLILKYHAILRPIWKQFRDYLFTYKYGVLPERKKGEALKKKNIDPSSPLAEYRELFDQDSPMDWEQFYDIKITVSFDPGHVTLYNRNINTLKNFLDLLDSVPISYFERCEHCEKCIIITRSDKRFCPGCAAKKYQADKWKKDPGGCKENERDRYKDKRKKMVK